MLRSLKERGLLQDTDSILVVAGGELDRQCMLSLGRNNVTISNLDTSAGHSVCEPYSWRHLDAENLETDDGSYDWVVIHAGLHHLAVPALGVCEMFRVARRGIVCFEARDSLLMKIAIKIGLTTEYELEAVFIEGASGGYRNGPIPNYVYRWTEREFEKVINSDAPTHRHTFFLRVWVPSADTAFCYGRGRLYRAVGLAIAALARVAEVIFPRQGNQFALGVLKNTSRQPWLNPELRFDAGFLASKYDKARYSGGGQR
jgi:SAM-dependent methyltransferase